MSLALIDNPPPWPGGARCAACLSFDLDAESLLHLNHREVAHSRIALSSALRYGPEVAIPRLVKILRHFGLQQTFFVPGWCLETYPRAIECLLEAGHELGHHGWLHERPNLLTADEEARVLDRALLAFDRVVGAHPRGYRAPAYALSDRTVGLLVERGFAYDASLMGDDVPYLVAVDGGRLVELPADIVMDDWIQYTNLKEFGYATPIRAPARAMEVFRAEFDAAWRHGGLFVSIWHPFVSGRLARAEAIVELLADLRDKEGVWFATMGQIAEHVAGLVAQGTWTPRIDRLPFWDRPVDHLVPHRPT